MLKVGLTGGIASGKTTISGLFEQRGVPVVDTDVISRQLLDIGEPGYEQVREHFGARILQQDGEIDRRKLRQTIFSDEAEKHWLESILHPLIYSQTNFEIQHCQSASYVLVVVPLLFETRFQTLVDRVLVVDCGVQTQIKRLLERDKIDVTLAQKMLDYQLSNQARIDQADDLIHNNTNDRLDDQVAALDKKYTAIANGPVSC